MRKIWIIGCGDIGKRLANLYRTQENTSSISGIVTSENSLIACTNLGIDSYKINLDEEDSRQHLLFNSNDFEDSNIFYFIPPPPQGKQDSRLEKFLSSIKSTPRRIVLISTTGVYGDSKGEWIDESTPVKPMADRAHRRLAAEKLLKNWTDNSACEYMILRVPGIYAKDRLPIARLQNQLPIVNQNEAGYTNRIHADDLANACLLAMQCDEKNETINITDGNPSTMTEYFNQVADYADLPRPPQISMEEAEATLSDGMVSYLKESRRIRNSKMLSILKIKLQYPDLDSALRR